MGFQEKPPRLHCRLRLGVQGTAVLIKNEEAGIPYQSAGKRNALALSTAKSSPTFTDAGVETLRKPRNKVPRLRVGGDEETSDYRLYPAH